MQHTRWDHGLKVTGDGAGLVGHAGAVLLRKLADQAGLTAALGPALARAGKSPLIDRGVALAMSAPRTTSVFTAFRFPAGGDLSRGPLVPAVWPFLPDVEELLTERGATVDHVTVHRWVYRFTPEFVYRRPGTAGDRSSAARGTRASRSPAMMPMHLPKTPRRTCVMCTSTRISARKPQ